MGNSTSCTAFFAKLLHFTTPEQDEIKRARIKTNVTVTFLVTICPPIANLLLFNRR
tara:strand:- start:715 stop:882 length:168 start_codon:yes stop_codon:yes gene_type:complete